MPLTPFGDTTSLLLWLIVASLAILVVYALRARETPAEKLRRLSAPLASVAIPLTGLSGWMTIIDPLAGRTHIILSEPLVYFGSLLIVAARLIARGNKTGLRELALPACVGGLFLVILAVAVVATDKLSAVSILWALAYASAGIGAICSRFLHLRIWRQLGMGALIAALAIFSFQAALSTLSLVGIHRL